MKALKTILKLIGALIIGCAAGLLLSSVGIVMFTDSTFSDFFSSFSNLELGEGVMAALIGIVSLVVSVPSLIIIHEAGHLVCGLLSGYSFVSFRIFDFTIIRSEGRLRVKRFAVAGTGGQCLLSPPDKALQQIPTALYNMGGVLANVLALLAVLPLFWCDLNAYVTEFLGIFVLTDIILILMNGVPMCINGIGNDAWNMRLLRHSMLSKRGMLTQLRSNALIQSGIRPKDMPAEWFGVPEAIDYRNALEVALPLMQASRMLDMERYNDAYAAFSHLYACRADMLGIYVSEVACELAYCAMVTGRLDEAGQLLDDAALERYIATGRRFMSSKERLQCARELYLNNNRPAAEAIYQRLADRRAGYLLQGEVSSDLALMRAILD